MTLTVHEVCMVLPDLVRLEIRDAPVTHKFDSSVSPYYGNLEEDLTPPVSGTPGTWNSGSPEYYLILGATRNYKRYEDLKPAEYLDRDAADVAGDWGTIGGRTVTAVYRKSKPYSQGEGTRTSLNNTTKYVGFSHKIYLQLDGNLAEGTHTIDFPTDTGISDYQFVFNDKVTRFAGIKSNQYGVAPADLMKFAYLAEWVPGHGTEGRVDFSAIADWHIINDAGTIVWSAGAAPVLRITATEAETNSGIDTDTDTGDVLLTSTTTPIRQITGYTLANPGVFTYTGDDLSNGQVIRIENMRQGAGATDEIFPANASNGSPNTHNLVVKDVDNSGPKTMKLTKTSDGLDLNTSSSPTYKEWKYAGDVYETNGTVNRSATNVYGLDFSSFVPSTQGVYYIYVEGYGVSHPFYIDNAVWHNVAATFAAGEYHHRHGIELDGRFGYHRPAGWSPDTTAIWDNLLPYTFSSEVGVGTATNSVSGIEVAFAPSSSYFINTEVDFFMGHHDAGDHDSRLGSHDVSYYGYLDFWLQYPEAAEATDWNIPKMLELFPDDTTYAGTNVLPDCWHQYMFSMYGYIAGISADNHARGGMNSNFISSLTPSWLWPSNDRTPSVDYSTGVYAPDHFTSIILCPFLANAAYALRLWDTRHSTSTFTTLAQYYEDKATALWTAAELIYDGGTAWGSGSTGDVDTARTALYGDYKTAADAASSGVFATNFGTRQTNYQTTGWRQAAAAAMYRMTGTQAYGDIVTGTSFVSMLTSPFQKAAWDYINTPDTHTGYDTTKRTAYRNAITSNAQSQITNYLAGNIGFKSLKKTQGNGRFGADGTDWAGGYATLAIMAYMLSEQASPGSGAVYRQAMEDGFHYGLGANLLGKSLVTGLGPDRVHSILHGDSTSQGVEAPIGIMVYGPCSHGGFTQNCFIPGPTAYVTANSSPAYTTDDEHNRKMTPSKHAWPMHENFVEVMGAIEHTEYVFGGSIGPQQWAAAVLWAGNGELDTEIGGGDPEPEPTPTPPSGGGGAAHPTKIKHEKERRGRQKKNELAIEQTIRLAHQRLTGKVTEPEILKQEPTPQRLAVHAEKLAAQLVEKSKDSAKQRTRNKAIIAELKRQADIIMQEEEEAIVTFLFH